MRYQTMPPLGADERDALERSIREHGIQVPVIVDELGQVIDGHHRQEIGDRLGIEVPVQVQSGLSEAQKVALSISLNVDRRQLSREQKRQIVAASIKADPEVTDREHARRTGASPSTVGAVREELEESGEVSKLDTRRDPRGYEQPASKPSNVVEITHRTSESVTEKVNAATGEVVDSSAREFITAAVESDQTVQDANYMHAFYKAITKADDLLLLDAERVGRLSDQADLTTLDQLVDNITRFRDRARKAGSGLRIVGGGQ